MPDSTYEEAKRCPRCSQPGVDVSNRIGPRGVRIHTIICKNQRCKWYDTNYIIQVNADGTIPDPILERPKSYPELPARTDVEVDAMLDRLYNSTRPDRR